MIPQVVKWIRFLAETIHVGFKTTFCKSKIKKYQWALLIGIENPVFQVRRPMKRFITVEMFRKKKSKTFQGIINFSQFYWNDRKFPVPLLHVDYKCQASTRAKGKNLAFFFFFFIAQNAYCSRDIYFQFNKVCRSVISCVDAMKAPQRLVALNAFGCSFKYDVGGKPN